MKKIISLTLALVILLGTVLSMGSCSLVFSPSVGGSGQNSGGTNEGGNQNNEGTEGDGSGNTDDSPETFYPGISDIDFTNLNASTRSLLSSVAVTSHFKKYTGYDYGYGYGSNTTTEYKQYGSGVIYRIDREAGSAYIITNFHVVYHRESSTSDHISTNIQVYLYGQESSPDSTMKSYAIPATFVGGSMTYDVAVLKIEDSDVIRNSIAIPVEPTDSDKVAVMDPVIAIGNAEGYGISATEGIVSIDNEELKISAADGYTSLTMRVMRISASINDGNSGGGLFTPEGKLLGIIVARRIASSYNEETENIAYAIPANLVVSLVDNIIHYCSGSANKTPFKCSIGFTPIVSARGVTVDPETGKVVKLEQITVSEISEGSLADGALQVGDIINSITIDGDTLTITRMHQIFYHVLKARAGSTVTISVTRGEEILDVTIITTNDSLKSVK